MAECHKHPEGIVEWLQGLGSEFDIIDTTPWRQAAIPVERSTITPRWLGDRLRNKG